MKKNSSLIDKISLDKQVKWCFKEYLGFEKGLYEDFLTFSSNESFT